MDLSFYIFLFLAITTIGGGSYHFFRSGSSIAGSIFLIGTLILSIFYGSRWFIISGVKANSTATWPPVINVCPDFMSVVTVTPEGKTTPQKMCVDTIGIYKNMRKWVPGAVANNSNTFDLSAGMTDTVARLKALCDQALDKGVTWEGVYTESVCGTTVPPLPA